MTVKEKKTINEYFIKFSFSLFLSGSATIEAKSACAAIKKLKHERGDVYIEDIKKL